MEPSYRKDRRCVKPPFLPGLKAGASWRFSGEIEDRAFGVVVLAGDPFHGPGPGTGVTGLVDGEMVDLVENPEGAGVPGIGEKLILVAEKRGVGDDDPVFFASFAGHVDAEVHPEECAERFVPLLAEMRVGNGHADPVDQPPLQEGTGQPSGERGLAAPGGDVEGGEPAGHERLDDLGEGELLPLAGHESRVDDDVGAGVASFAQSDAVVDLGAATVLPAFDVVGVPWALGEVVFAVAAPVMLAGGDLGPLCRSEAPSGVAEYIGGHRDLLVGLPIVAPGRSQRRRGLVVSGRS
jgi:hypothetical protein